MKEESERVREKDDKAWITHHSNPWQPSRGPDIYTQPDRQHGRISKTSELAVLTNQDIMTWWTPIRDRVGGARDAMRASPKRDRWRSRCRRPRHNGAVVLPVKTASAQSAPSPPVGFPWPPADSTLSRPCHAGGCVQIPYAMPQLDISNWAGSRSRARFDDIEHLAGQLLIDGSSVVG